MAKIKHHDFIEIEYTGRLKDENIIFDTTDKKTAEDNNVFNPDYIYGPVKVIVGNRQILSGLDLFIEGKEPGSYTVEIKAEEGFGKKDSKLLKLMPKSLFIKEKINPVPGLPVNIDGLNGIIKTVSGGRCIIDFNHPLAGKDLVYEIKINKIVTDDKEQVESILDMQMKKDDFNVSLENGKAMVTFKKSIAKPVKDLILDMIKRFTKVKDVEFKEEKKQTNP